MSEATHEPAWARCGDTTPRDRRNMRRVLWAFVAWAVCFTAASQLIKRDLLPAGPVPWLMAALPCVAAVFVIVVYGRFLREADELQRLVQLQALALGCGGTFFALGCYQVFERLGAPAAEIGDFTFVMPIFYLLGSFLGWRRYR